MGQTPSQTSDLKPGDHICVGRAAGFYQHHGIYIGEEMVIHFIPYPKQQKAFSSYSSASSGPAVSERCLNCGFSPDRDGGIVKTCLDCFHMGYPVIVVKYGDELALINLNHRSPSDPPQKVVERAILLFEHDSFGDYRVFKNNCEHFATYCKIGCRISKQTSQ